MAKTILVLEDDPSVRADIQTALSAAGHRVLATDLLASAWHLFTSEKPDLAVLDITVPDGSGLDLCRKIRDHKELFFTPVIILTGHSEFETKAAGFQAGADQYLVKPVPPRELALWVESMLRRMEYGKEEGVVRAGECAIDVKAHLVRYKDQVIPYLTCKEFELLYFLVKKRPQVLSRKHILSKLWHTIAVDRVVDTHLANLRKKLPVELADKIQAVPGKGYRFLE
ncbi:MAG: response regulator transcription factor [Elusimicrobiota bacterium]